MLINNDIDDNEYGDHNFPNGLNPFVKILQYRKLSKFVSKKIKHFKMLSWSKKQRVFTPKNLYGF